MNLFQKKLCGEIRFYAMLLLVFTLKANAFSNTNTFSSPTGNNKQSKLNVTSPTSTNSVTSVVSETNTPMSTVTEISTGEMLGYTQLDQKRSFYVRINGGTWKKTYSGAMYNSAAQGKLMNFRAGNALFDDENRTDDNPDANTNDFIAQLDSYKAHGLLAFDMCLQGGYPGYEGAKVSAFNNDGSLKVAWMDRCGRVIKAANAKNMIVILGLFYQRQDQILTDDNAVRQAVRNVCDWLIVNNHRNVIIEIANEYAHTGYDRAIIKNNTTTNGLGELIEIAKAKFNGLGWSLPVSASGMGGGGVSGVLKNSQQLALIHGNGSTPSADANMTKILYNDATVHGPIVMNEDENGDAVNQTNLDAEKATATGIFNAGGSWGFMWRIYNQYNYPFDWELGPSIDISGGSEANYFHAVLDHILSLVKANVITPSVSISASVNTIKTGTSTIISINLNNFVNTITSYQWNWGGTIENSTGNTSVKLNKTFATKGVYDVTLSVTDNATPANTYISNIITINVVDNYPPVISKVMYELAGSLDIKTSVDRGFIIINEGERLDFFVQGSDAERDPITYSWDLDGDGIFETSGQSVQKIFSKIETINGNVRLSDATGFETRAVNIKVNAIKAPFIEVNGLVSLEAENFMTNEIRTDGANTEWYKSTLIPVFSGDEYITTKNNNVANGAWTKASEVSYDVKFQTEGTYFVWLRRYAPDDASNSVYVGIDGIELVSSDNGTTGVWGWYKLSATFSVSNTGVKTIQICRREDGYMVDKILITNDSNYDPSVLNSGLGPVESHTGIVYEKHNNDTK